MKTRVKLVVILLLLLAALWPSALWASDPAVTIVWPGTNSRGQVMLTLTTNAKTYTKIVPYGEGSTAASIASAFGAHISMSPSWPVYAKGYPNGTLKMKLKANTSETITDIQVCVASSGTCVGSPSGTSFQTGSVLPAGPVLDDALYGFIIAKTDGSSGYDGVGNVVAYQDQVNQQWTASYDSLNRLKSASQTILPSQGTAFNIPGGTGVQQYFCWNYDSFGNRTSQIASGALFADTSSCQPSSSAYHNDTSATYDANNRLTSGTGMSGLSYDAAGNLVEDGNYSYKYDGDGRLCAVWRHVTGLVTGYLYDAEGTRVAKGSVSSFDCPTTSNFTITNQYIAGPDGQQMTELDGSGNWIHTNIFAGGSLIATDDNAGRHYQLDDWLGNRRMQVDPNGNIEASYQAGPYGDLLNNAPITTEHYFTGKERDAESGLDYFGFRSYSPALGRFMSPDPSGLASVNPANPQSWNLYSYVLNNPLINVDPNGLDCVYFNDSGTGLDNSSDPIDHNSSAGECGKTGGAWVNGTTDSSLVSANKDGTFNIGSYDDKNAYLTQVMSPQPNASGWSKFLGTACSGGTSCQVASSAPQSLSDLRDQLRPTGGSVYGMLQWAVQQTNGVPFTENQSFGMDSGWCGHGGSGMPGASSGWACMAHDYNYQLSGNTWPGHNADPNQTWSGGPQLQRINQQLCTHTSNILIQSFFSQGYNSTLGIGSTWGCQ